MFSIRPILAFALVVCLSLPPPSFSDVSTRTCVLDQSNQFADGVTYGSVQVSADSGTGKVSFAVEAACLSVYGSPSNFGFQTFGFNVADNVTSAPGGWTLDLPSGWSVATGATQDGFGVFDVVISGTGGTRQVPLSFTLTLPDPGEAVASFFVSPTSGTPAQGTVCFAGHLAGFTENPYSHFIGGDDPSPSRPVPAPGAVILTVIGIVLIGLLGRRSVAWIR